MMRFFRPILFICFFLSVFSSEAQINYQVDSSIVKLLDRYRSLNTISPRIKGYRVQLVAKSGSNARKEAETVRAQFMSKYPDVPSYLIPQLPNFKVRVGNFRDRYEAYRFLKEIKAQFPAAFIVNDQIGYPSLEVEPAESTP